MKKVVFPVIIGLLPLSLFAQTTNTFPNNGDVGIGTTSPNQQIHIKEQSTDAVKIKMQNDNSLSGGLLIGINSGNSNGNNAIFNLKENRNMIFKTNAIEHMRIDNIGNIGIGNTSPAARLDVTGTFRLDDGNQQAGYFLATDANGNASWQAVPTSSSPWTLGSGNLYYTGGFVGIGTTTPGTSTPNAMLEVLGRTVINGTDQNQTRLTFANAGLGATQIYWDEPSDLFNIQASRAGGAGINFIVRDNTNVYHDVLNLNQNSNIGMGTQSPSAKLDVVGTFQLQDGTEGAGYVLTSDVDGNASWQALPAPAMIGTSTNPYTELYATDFIKVGNNSLYLGSNTMTPGVGEYIYTSNDPLIINGLEANNTPALGGIQNTIINPNGGRVGVGVDDGNLSTGVEMHLKGKMLIDGANSTLLFGSGAAPINGSQRGQFGIEYLDGSSEDRGLNIWKPFGSDNMAGGQGFVNHLLFINNDGIIGMGVDPAKLTTDNMDGYRLNVANGIRTERVKVQLQIDWADYVFEDGYQLMSLNEVEQYISENGHLPNVPAADVIEETGLELGEMNVKLMEKIEELTLYLIEMKKENEVLRQDIEQLKNR